MPLGGGDAAVSSSPSPHLVSSSSPHGNSSTKWSASPLGVVPAGTACARITPRSLMLNATVICQLEPGAISLFKSSIGPSPSHKNACRKALQLVEPPTTCPREFKP